jgi:hypothetical protein
VTEVRSHHSLPEDARIEISLGLEHEDMKLGRETEVCMQDVHTVELDEDEWSFLHRSYVLDRNAPC